MDDFHILPFYRHTTHHCAQYEPTTTAHFPIQPTPQLAVHPSTPAQFTPPHRNTPQQQQQQPRLGTKTTNALMMLFCLAQIVCFAVINWCEKWPERARESKREREKERALSLKQTDEWSQLTHTHTEAATCTWLGAGFRRLIYLRCFGACAQHSGGKRDGNRDTLQRHSKSASSVGMWQQPKNNEATARASLATDTRHATT